LKSCTFGAILFAEIGKPGSSMDGRLVHGLEFHRRGHMRRLLVLLVGCLLSPFAGATKYTYTGGPYTDFTDYYDSPCTAGPCAKFPAGGAVSGWFTTASPLANVSKNSEITPLVTAYSFTDGITTYSSADPNSRIYTMQVEADASGNIGFVEIEISVWKTGSAPHKSGDRISEISIATNGISQASNNSKCLQVGAGNAGIPDTCVSQTADGATSEAAGSYGTLTSTVTPAVGLWWNPLESGSGYNIDVKHGVLVMTVYSYLPNGEQAWYITSGPIVNGSFTGTLDRYVGGQCIACAYNGLPTSAGSGGVVTIDFTSPTSATMYLPGGRVTEIQPEAF
jgi:hypothetical protein